MRWFDRLRRVTSGGRFVPEVDGLRFVAVLGVFLFHLKALVTMGGPTWSTPLESHWLAMIVEHGHYGVQLFFVISGFVLGLAFVRAADPKRAETFEARRYFARRVTRLEPPYVVNLLVLFAMLVVLRGYDAALLVPRLLASLFYVHGFVYGEPSTVNPVAWSLEVEVQFYLLAPLLALPLRWSRAARRGFYGTAILGLLAWRATSGIGEGLHGALPIHLHYFLGGLLLADVYVRDWNEESPNSRWGDVLAVGLVPLIVASWFAPFAVTSAVFPPLVIVWCGAVLASRGTRWLLSRSVPVVVGGMCYSVYLWHVPAMWACGRGLGGLPRSSSFAVEFLVKGAFCGAAVLLVAGLAFVLIERPCMRANWPRRAGRAIARRWHAWWGTRSEAAG